MQLVWRKIAPGETDHELLWLTVSLGALAAAGGWLALGLPWPHCVFLSLTGHPCLTCGATRAAIQFFHGNFFAAWRWNPLAFAGLCAVSLFNLYAASVLITRARRLRVRQFTYFEKNLIRLTIVILLGANWIYLLSHWPNH